MTIKNFPYLSEGEFKTACLSLCNLLSNSKELEYKLCSSEDETAYITINRKHTLAHLDKNDTAPEEYLLDDHEDIDAVECLQREKHNSSAVIIEYHIILSPAYMVPVLYFIMVIGSTPASLDEIYKHLVVASGYGREIKSVGVMGAISQGDHPVEGRPFWFIHPCHTAMMLQQWGEARQKGDSKGPGENFDETSGITLRNYLQIWLGIVGGCVGFHLPVEAVTSQQVEK